MSKSHDALKQVERRRSARTQHTDAIQQFEALTPERLDDEVRRFEASLSAWRTPRPAGPAAMPQPEPAASKNETNGSRAQASTNGAGEWDEEIRRCQTLAASCEERLAFAQQQRASLQGQAADQERIVAQAAAYLTALQQRLQESETGVRRAEADRAAHGEWLSALRQCQALAQASAEAEHRLQAHTETIGRIARVQQRVAEKLSQHQREAQEMRSSAEALRRELSEALSRAQHSAGSIVNGGGRHE